MSEVKITIEGEGLSLTKYTSLQKAGQIISFLGMEQQQVSEQQVHNVSPALLVSSRQPKDFISDSGAKTYPQKIVALGKYFKDELGRETFSSQELRNLFKKIGDEPRNFSRDFKEALERQYVNCVDQSNDQYELTDKGDEEFQEGFSHKATKRSNSKKVSASKGVREEVKNLQILGSMDELPDYHDLSAKADKILWLLHYADTNNIKGLTPAEVDFLSTELRDRVKTNDFAAHNTRNIKKSFVTKTSEGFLIQKKGLDHLKNGS